MASADVASTEVAVDNQSAGSGSAPSSDHGEDQKSDYAIFCDKLRHPSAKPVIAKARNFVLCFPQGLNREEAADRVHRFINHLEKWMLTEVVVFAAEADDEGREQCAEGLEKFLLSRLHPRIFAAEPEDVADDAKLRRHIDGLSWVRLKHLGVPSVDTSLLPVAIDELRRMDDYKAPRDKLTCVLNSCRAIHDVLKRTVSADGKTRALSADDFLPLLIWVIIMANPLRFHSNVEFLATFRHPARLCGEAAYFVTMLMSAKEFVKDAGHECLDVTQEEYDQNYAKALADARSDPIEQVIEEQQAEELLLAEVAVPAEAAEATEASANPSVVNLESAVAEIAAEVDNVTGAQADTNVVAAAAVVEAKPSPAVAAMVTLDGAEAELATEAALAQAVAVASEARAAETRAAEAAAAYAAACLNTPEPANAFAMQAVCAC